MRRRTPARPSNFNPRSREGSDHPGQLAASRRLISIHAPVKGATCTCQSAPQDCVISIHAPVKGATMREFNADHGDYISIHAPVKGATAQ